MQAPGSKHGPAKTLKTSERIRRALNYHAGGVLIVPLLGTIEATRLAFDSHFARWNLYVLLLFWIVSGIGITLVYHRLATHRAFEASTWLKRA